jgi:hypothetical protein
MLERKALAATVEYLDSKRRSAYASREDKALPTYKVGYATFEQLYAAIDAACPTRSLDARAAFKVQVESIYAEETKRLLGYIASNEAARAAYEEAKAAASAAYKAVMAEALDVYYREDSTSRQDHLATKSALAQRRAKAEAAYKAVRLGYGSVEMNVQHQQTLDSLEIEYRAIIARY